MNCKVRIAGAVVLAVSLLAGCGSQADAARNSLKIGVTLYDQYDTFLSQLMERFNADLSDEKKAAGMEIAVNTYGAGKSQKTQDEQVREMIERGSHVVCVNLVDRTAPTTIIDTARKNDVPVIFFNRELVEEDLEQWDKLYYVGADADESGDMQGELALDDYKNGKITDRNGDGSIDYLVLMGEADHQDAIVRTERVVDTMISGGMKLNKAGHLICNWNRDQAEAKMTQIISQYGTDGIDLVLANNDDMALGAIDAYDNASIPEEDRPEIFGIDGTEEGLAAVKEGTMAGTVYNDKEGQASAMLELAVRLYRGESLKGMSNMEGHYIRLPYRKVTAENVHIFIEKQS